MTVIGLLLTSFVLSLALACGGESTPTPESTPVPTFTAATPLAGLSPVVLSAAELRGLTHLGIRPAMADLRQRPGGDLERVQVIAAEVVTWRDAALGCPEPRMMYAQVLTSGMRVVFRYEGQEFDYHIAGIHGLLCAQEQTQEPLDRQSLAGIWSRLAGLPTPRSEVAAAELNGKIYVFGGFGAGATANEE